MSDKQTVAQIRRLLGTLVTTPGPTGAEQPRLEVLERWTADAGLDTHRDAVGNLWIDVCGDGPWEQTLVLDAHVDVVGAGYAETLDEREGKLIGAGVADNLSAASMLAVLAQRVRSGEITPGRPVKVVYTVGEEGLGNLRGIRQVTDDHAAAPYLLVSLDGTRRKCHVAGLGANRYRLIVTGDGGHSWSAYGTPSATEGLLSLLGRIQHLHQREAAATERTVSFNLGTLAGGEGINCIARRAEATFEFRSADPEALARLDDAARAAIDMADRGGDLSAALEAIGARPAAERMGNEAAEAAIRRVWETHGFEVATTIASTNINIPLACRWPAICVGLIVGGNGHREDEFIEIESLATGWALLTDLVDALTAR